MRIIKERLKVDKNGALATRIARYSKLRSRIKPYVEFQEHLLRRLYAFAEARRYAERDLTSASITYTSRYTEEYLDTMEEKVNECEEILRLFEAGVFDNGR